jgi:hypothetical protein
MTSVLIVVWCMAACMWTFNILMFCLRSRRWFVYPILCCYGCPEIGTNSVDCAQLSSSYLKTEAESSLRNIVFLNRNRTMDNIRKLDMDTEGDLPGGLIDRRVKLTIRLNLVPRSRMVELHLHSPHMSSWHIA